MDQECDMAAINPFDKILLSINDKFSVASKKANASKAVKYGNAGMARMRPVPGLCVTSHLSRAALRGLS